MIRVLSAGLIVAVAAGCGGSPSSPSPPSIIQVGGLWRGPVRLTSVSGGECVGAALQGAIGATTTYTLALQQSGASLTGTSTAVDSGDTCNFSGTAGVSAISLNATQCSAELLIVTCPNGAIRRMQLTGATLNATMSGSSGSGTFGESYNITTASGAPVGILTDSGTLTMTRQ